MVFMSFFASRDVCKSIERALSQMLKLSFSEQYVMLLTCAKARAFDLQDLRRGAPGYPEKRR